MVTDTTGTALHNTDQILRASAGIVVAEVQRVSAGIAKDTAATLAAATTKLAAENQRVMQQGAAAGEAAFARGAASLVAQADRLIAAHTAPIRLRTRMVTMIVATVLLVTGLALGYGLAVDLDTPPLQQERIKLVDMQTRLIDEQTFLNELDHHGSRTRWSTCGGRLCIAISADQGEQDGQKTPFDAWMDSHGHQFVIPSGY